MSEKKSMENKAEQPLVSVIVLNYNGKHFLRDCFETLRSGTYPNQELMLVDNESSDGSVDFVKENFPEVKILESGGNIGFSAAYNKSFEVAKGKYFVLLNNDTKVTPDWLTPLVKAAEADDSIGALQPKIVSMIDLGYFEYAGSSGGFMDWWGFPFLRGRIFNTIEKDEGQYDDEVNIFWTSGACMFVRAEALQYTGGLDEDFVHHMEEIDLCWRLHLHGYQLKVIPQGMIYHYAGATIKADSYKKIYWNHRNSLFMLHKNLNDENLKTILPKRWQLDMMAMGKGLLTGEFKRIKAIYQAYKWMRKNKSLVTRKREAVQNHRKVADSTIFRKLYPRSIALDYFLRGKKKFNQLNHQIDPE